MPDELPAGQMLQDVPLTLYVPAPQVVHWSVAPAPKVA